MDLFDLTFLDEQKKVIFLGPPGVGKTHLAISLAIKTCSHGFKVYFTTMNTLNVRPKEIQSASRQYHIETDNDTEGCTPFPFPS